MDAEGHRGAERAGASDPFSRYVVPELPALLRVARSLSSSPHDAEDLVQETLLRAYRAIHTFDGAHPRAWLFTILRNVSANRFRARRPESLERAEDAEAVPETRVSDPAELTESRAFTAAVRAAMGELPEARRRVMELVDVDGLAYAEAAAVLGVPVGTVMSRLHRARRSVREYLILADLAPTKGSRR